MKRDSDTFNPVNNMVTLSSGGFIKRVPASTFKLQHRSGKGMGIMETGTVRLLSKADTHDDLLFFTNRGKVFHLKCHEIPVELSRTAEGVAVINLFSIGEGELVTALVATTGFKPDAFLVMATRLGEVKKTALTNFAAVRSSGIIATDLEAKDELIGAAVAIPGDDVVLVTEMGQSIRFPADSLRTASRTSGGVRGIRLSEDDRVVNMAIACPDSFLLTVTMNGYGKLTPIKSYKRQSRGGVGVKTLKVTEKTGKVASAKLVYRTQQLMIMTADGMKIITPIKGEGSVIPVQSRGSQGVRLMKMDEGDQLVSIVTFN